MYEQAMHISLPPLYYYYYTMLLTNQLRDGCWGMFGRFGSIGKYN